MEFTDIIDRVYQTIDSVDFSEEINKFKIHPEHQIYLQSKDKAYIYRAALVKVLGAKTALEVGTKTGCGALALAKYAEHVVACDITLQNVQDRNIFNSNIEGRELEFPEDCLKIDYHNFDFVVIDIDHQGEMEYRIHQVLQATYKGIVLYDDIKLNKKMIDFWNKIDNEKVETDWHEWYGVGLVRY